MEGKTGKTVRHGAFKYVSHNGRKKTTYSRLGAKKKVVVNQDLSRSVVTGIEIETFVKAGAQLHSIII